MVHHRYVYGDAHHYDPIERAANMVPHRYVYGDAHHYDPIKRAANMVPYKYVYGDAHHYDPIKRAANMVPHRYVYGDAHHYDPIERAANMVPYKYVYGDAHHYDPIERNYRTTLSKTNLRSDRGDLRLHTFAGSHLHGGAPAAERPMATRLKGNKNIDLYAPLGDTPYVRGGYYDHLRATTPEPKKRPARSAPLMDDPLDYSTGPRKFNTDADYKTLPSRFDYLESELKKPMTKTTTTVTERWVPLTTYIYHTPFHSYYYKSTPYMSHTYRTADDLYSYNYLDDYKRYSTTTTKNIDALDLSTTTKFDYSSYAEKCSKIQSQLDEVNRWMSEAESKIKSEVVTSRNKLQTDLAEVAMIVEDTAKYNDELHNAIRKQAKRISSMSHQYEDINRNIADILDTLDRSKARCQTLQSEVNSMKSSLDMSTTKHVTKTIIY